MTFRNLSIFTAVCNKGGITAAAEELNMAQPAVSLAIKEMEAYYGVRLFERMNRRIYMTEAGRKLLVYAESVLGQMEEAKDVLTDMKDYTRLRIGTNVSYGVSIYPEMLSEFQRKYASIPIYTMIGNSGKIEEQLLRNGLDFGIIDNPVNHEMFHAEKVAEDVMIATCTEAFYQKWEMNLQEPTHSRREKIPVLVREEGSGSRALTDLMIQKNNLQTEVIAESSSIQCLIEMTLRDMGMVFLPETVVKPYLKKGKLREVRLGEPNVQREYFLVYHRSKYMTRSMKRFREYCIGK